MIEQEHGPRPLVDRDEAFFVGALIAGVILVLALSFVLGVAAGLFWYGLHVSGGWA